MYMMYMQVWVCIYNMYVCVYSYICMYVGVHVCVCTCGVRVWGTCVSVFCVGVNSSPSLCMVVGYSDFGFARAIRTR